MNGPSASAPGGRATRAGSWWTGTRLVAGRAVAEGVASRSWRAVTALLLLAGIAVVVLPRIIGGGAADYQLATIGSPPPALVAGLEATGKAGDFTVKYAALADGDDVRQAVEDGDADAGLVPGKIYVSRNGSGTFPTIVSAAVREIAVVEALVAAGLQPQEVARIQATPPPAQVVVGPVQDEGRAAVGFASGIVLYLALIVAGTGLVTTVATEKTTRVSEVLLAVLRPTQMLVGTVLGAGALAMAQLAAIVIPVAVSLVVTDSPYLPAAAAPDVALAVIWFVLGLSLYAFVFAALAALVDKLTEVNSAVVPVYVVLIASYFIAVTVVVSDPNNWLSVIASLFPLSAPLVMPARWASGVVPVWQLTFSMLLTAGGAVLLALLASQVYRRGIVRTGRRLTIRDALGR